MKHILLSALLCTSFLVQANPHPDLDRTPQISDAMKQSIEARLRELEESSKTQVDTLSVTIPDYAQAQLKLRKQVEDGYVGFIKNLASVQQSYFQYVAKMKSLKDASVSDSSGILASLYQVEAGKLTKTMSDQVTRQYYSALRSAFVFDNENQVPITVQYIAPGPRFSRYGCRPTDYTWGLFSIAKNITLEQYCSKKKNLTAEEQAAFRSYTISETYSFYSRYQCRTGACVIQLSKDLAEVYNTAQNFDVIPTWKRSVSPNNIQASYVQPLQNTYTDLTRYILLSAAKRIMDDPNEQKSHFVAMYLAESALDQNRKSSSSVITQALNRTLATGEDFLGATPAEKRFQIVLPNFAPFSSELIQQSIYRNAIQAARAMDAVTYQ